MEQLIIVRGRLVDEYRPDLSQRAGVFKEERVGHWRAQDVEGVITLEEPLGIAPEPEEIAAAVSETILVDRRSQAAIGLVGGRRRRHGRRPRPGRHLRRLGSHY